jgi:hypothetical protein
MMSARYWIAQHVSDLFRNEPRNVGVFIKVGDCMTARFFGETEDGQIDSRRLKVFSHPGVYQQWVEYWRNQLSKNDPNILVKTSGAHYRVIEAGEITDVDNDSPEDVANYLYALLVSEGGFREAVRTGEESTERAVISLEADLINEFRARNLLGDDGNLLVPHPVRRGIPVSGKHIRHKPAFVQENGSLYVMETVDFTITQKKRSRDHAGWSAYMFRDIRDGKPNSEMIAVVRVTDKDQEVEEVANGMAALKNEANIVNWLDDQQKKQFLEERRIIAMRG